tara:strand:+ start:10 stop:738 length:729 start_codon:yes stop_codon:yes gene_type:complete
MKIEKPEFSTVIFVLSGLSVILIPLIIFTVMFFMRGSSEVLVSTFVNYGETQITNDNLKVKIHRISYHPKTKIRKSSRWFTGSYTRPGYTQIDGTMEILSPKPLFPTVGVMKIYGNNKNFIERSIIMESKDCSVVSSKTEPSQIKFTSRYPTNLEPSIKKLILSQEAPAFEINVVEATSTENCEDIPLKNDEVYISSQSFSIGKPEILKYQPYKIYEFEESSIDNIWTEWIVGPRYGELESP